MMLEMRLVNMKLSFAARATFPDDVSLDDVFARPYSPIRDAKEPGRSVEESLERSIGLLKQLVQRGVTHWVVTYSGGKDSTLLTVLACEVVRRKLDWMPSRVDVVYSDTLQEIPAMHETALNFLAYINQVSRDENLPIRTHIVRPEPRQTFWFLVLGKGYPVPHRRFWWCTERLKINPVKKVLRDLAGQNVAVLTGVRFGESDRRDASMEEVRQLCGRRRVRAGAGLSGRLCADCALENLPRLGLFGVIRPALGVAHPGGG